MPSVRTTSLLRSGALTLGVAFGACLPSDFDQAERTRADQLRAEHAHNELDAGMRVPDAASLPPSADSGSFDGGGRGQDAGRSPMPPLAAAGMGGRDAPQTGIPGRGASAPGGPAANAGAGGKAGAAGATVAAGAGGVAGAQPGASMCGDTVSATNNCGKCGNDCSAASANVSCVESSCVRACAADSADCNSDLSSGTMGDGCETPIASDLDNCGGCGARCEDRAGLVADCAASSCGYYHASIGAAHPIGTGLHGFPEGGDPFSHVCGRDAALVGIDVAASATSVSGLAAVCAQLYLQGTPASFVVLQRDATAFPLIGNMISIQTVSRLQCPRGEVVSAVNGVTWYEGENQTLLSIKQLSLGCSALHVDAQQIVIAAPSSFLTAGDGADAVEKFADACSLGEVVAGFNGRGDGLIDALRTECAPLHVTRDPK
jgi:hypothetical protein